MLSFLIRKHVLSEKPLGKNCIESSEIEECAIKNNRMIYTGFNHRFHPSIIKAQKISLELKSTLGELVDRCSSWFLSIKIIDAKCFSKRQNLETDKTQRPMWTENIKVFKLNSWINELRTWKGYGTHNLKTFHSSYSRQLFTSLLFCLLEKHRTLISFGIKNDSWLLSSVLWSNQLLETFFFVLDFETRV